jgi:hypothetical protein
MIAFDILVGNVDRNRGNVLLEVIDRNPNTFRLWIIDHGRSILADADSIEEALGRNPSVWDCLPDLRAAIDSVTSIGDFAPYLTRIEELRQPTLQHLLGLVPPEFWPLPLTISEDLPNIARWLEERAAAVRGYLLTARRRFPHWT